MKRPSSVVRPSTFHILIFSETIGPVRTKLCMNDPWEVGIQVCSNGGPRVHGGPSTWGPKFNIGFYGEKL